MRDISWAGLMPFNWDGDGVLAFVYMFGKRFGNYGWHFGAASERSDSGSRAKDIAALGTFGYFFRGELHDR
jgi:hypothetical protein